MPKLKLETLALLLTLGAVLLTQAWPSVVAFIAASALYFMLRQRGDRLQELKAQSDRTTALIAKIADQSAEIQKAHVSLEARLVAAENVIAVSQNMTRF